MRLFTILFMGALTIGATYTIGPLLLSLFVGFIGSALKGTITGGSLLMGMLFTSMAAFLGGFWGAFLYLVLPRTRPLEAGGQPKSETGDLTRVQSPNFSPWQAAFIGSVFLPFAFAFLTIIVGGGMEPPLGIAIACWLALIAALAFFPARILLRRRHGDYDIIIDGSKREISLPVMDGRKERLAFSFSDIEALTIEEAWDGSGRGSKFRSWIYLVTKSSRELAAMFTSQSESAHAFREWLEHKLGLPTE
ncbi:MAG TPA: hypothetical protein VGO52_02590 [Hyphomonadaceae bacterium]|jgi:hypothetical protein|nr:hypothetical protein [Hyphomonadaceae bacterium]